MSHVFWHSGHHRQSRSTSGPRPRSAEWVAHRSASTPEIEKWHRRYTNHTLPLLILSPRFSPGMSPELSYTYSIWICRETFSGWAYHFLFTQQLLLWGQSFLYLRHSNPFTTPPGYTSTVRFYWSCFVDMLHIIINSDYCVHKCSSSNLLSDRSNRLRYFEEAVVVVQTVIVVVDTFI